tara:strand:+ start:2443 stop:2574 length:132 start_codon:yes stop_codon:yes gene_type:complete
MEAIHITKRPSTFCFPIFSIYVIFSDEQEKNKLRKKSVSLNEK